MRWLSSGWLRPAVVGALVGLVVVFVFDLVQPSPVIADVVERLDEAPGIGERVTVLWVDEDGSTRTEELVVPDEYVGEDRVPVVPNDLGPYVDDGRLSFKLYLFAALAGMLIGGPVAQSLRKGPYSEAPIREVTTGSGV